MTTFAFVTSTPKRAATSGHGRYEYRIWPRGTPPGIARLQQGWALAGAERRTDIYLLSANSPNTLVKLRDGARLEVKRREQDHGHLQHWSVALSDDFPVTSSTLNQLCAALLTPQPLPQAARLSPAHLLGALAECCPSVEPRLVRKSRLSFERNGWRAEITRAAWQGRTHLTLALEGSDRDGVAREAMSLGWGAWPNRSFGDMLCACPLPIMKPVDPRNT